MPTPATSYGRKRKLTLAYPTTKRRRTMPTRYRRKTAYTKRVPVKTKTAARINKSRISRLEEKVNGHVQRGYHQLSIRYNPGTFTWSPAQPILVCLNDFYSQTTAAGGGTGSAYYPTYAGAPPNVTMQANVLDRFVDFLPGASLGFAPQYQQWSNQRLSQPSKVGYQPLYTDIRIVLNRAACTPSGGDLWVRVDCFRARKTYLSVTGGPDPKIYNMPQALGALSHMAVGPNTRSNSFNPALWSVKTRWIKLPAVDIDSRDINTIFHVKMGFPKKFLSTNVDVTSAGVGEQFYNCVDPKQVHWMLLSISRDSPNQTTDPTPTITMTRKVVYRDSRGAQM